MILKVSKWFILLVLLSLAGCALTSKVNLQQGIKSFQIQDYRRAFIKLKPEADRGNAQAQYAVGYMYFYGQGVVEDRKQAFYWIRCAANAGYPDAIEALKILKRPAKARENNTK